MNIETRTKNALLKIDDFEKKLEEIMEETDDKEKEKPTEKKLITKKSVIFGILAFLFLVAFFISRKRRRIVINMMNMVMRKIKWTKWIVQ